MAAVQSTPTGRSYYEAAVRDSFTDRFESLCPAKDILRVNGHGPGPETFGATATNKYQLLEAGVFHCTGDRSDITGCFGPYEYNANLFEHLRRVGV